MEKKSNEASKEQAAIIIGLFKFNASSFTEEVLRVANILEIEASAVLQVATSERNVRAAALKVCHKKFLEKRRGGSYL